MARKRRERGPSQPVQRAPAEYLTASQRQELFQAQISQTFTGPLPHPDILVRYNQAVPDGAERLIAMAERQSAHRINLETKVVDADIRRAYLGVIAGFIVVLAALFASYKLIDRGHEIEGAAVGTVDIGGVAGIFVYGTISRRREREDRVRAMTGQQERQ